MAKALDSNDLEERYSQFLMLQITIKALKYLELRAHGMTSSLEREFHRRLDRKWNDGRDKI